MEAITLESDASVLLQMLKRENRYHAPLPSNPCVKQVQHRHSSSPVSSTAFSYTEVNSILDPAVVRKGVCEWMYRIIDHYKLERDIIPMAMSCFDRFVICKTQTATPDQLSKTFYQLIAVSSLHICIKSHSSSRLNYLPAFVKLSNGRFSTSDILDMELQMLQALKWGICHPTPQAFACEMIFMLSHTVPQSLLEIMLEVANYIIECAYLQPEYYQEDHSILSFSATILALSEVHRTVLPQAVYAQLCEKIAFLLQCDFERILNLSVQMKGMYDHESAHMNLKQLYSNVDPQGMVYQL